MGKDKGRTKKQKPFSYKVRQGKDKGKTVKNKTLFSKRVEGKKRKKKEKKKEKKEKQNETPDDVKVNCLTQFTIKQGRIHGYLSRVRLGRGSNKSLQASKQQNPGSRIDVMDRQTDGQTDQPKDQHSVL